MNKLILIPIEQYNNMMSKEKNSYNSIENKDLNKEIAATIKNQETQELIQRKNEYKEAHEEIPKSLDKTIPQTAATLIPPVSKRKKVEKPKKPRKPAQKKPKKTKFTPCSSITFAHKKPPNTFNKWKFIED